MFITFNGQTLHDFKTGRKVRAYRSARENFQDVFGPFWVTNFIIPMQLVFRQNEFEQPMLLQESNFVQNGGPHVVVGIEE